MNEKITNIEFKKWCQNYFEKRPKPLSGLTLGELSKKNDVFHYAFEVPQTNRITAFEKMVPAALSRELSKAFGVSLSHLKELVGFNIEGNKINLFSSIKLTPNTEQALQDKFELTKRQALSSGAKLDKKDDQLDDFVHEIKAIASVEDKAKAILKNRSLMGMISETMKSYRSRNSTPEKDHGLAKKVGLNNGLR